MSVTRSLISLLPERHRGCAPGQIAADYHDVLWVVHGGLLGGSEADRALTLGVLPAMQQQIPPVPHSGPPCQKYVDELQ